HPRLQGGLHGARPLGRNKEEGASLAEEGRRGRRDQPQEGARRRPHATSSHVAATPFVEQPRPRRTNTSRSGWERPASAFGLLDPGPFWANIPHVRSGCHLGVKR